MKILPVSGALALAVVAAAIALAGVFSGPGKANASTVVSVDACTPVHVSPETVWGGLTDVLDVDRDQHAPNRSACATADCVASGGQCGTCTRTILSVSVISTSTDANGVTRNLVERRWRKECTCGYNRVLSISYWVQA